jgi:hypothetical protein
MRKYGKTIAGRGEIYKESVQAADAVETVEGSQRAEFGHDGQVNDRWHDASWVRISTTAMITTMRMKTPIKVTRALWSVRTRFPLCLR